MPGSLKPLGPGFFPRIYAVAHGLGATLGDDAIARIAAWFDLMAVWNAKIDLTAARNPDELADLMLADAMVLARHVTPGASFVDVGSGAGAPGLALYLVRSDLRITLVEPLQKRIAFLRTTAGQLGPGLGGGSLRVTRGRGEDLESAGPRFDAAVARATLSPEEWLGLGARLVGESGSVWVLLAREAPPQLAGFHVTVDESYKWPLTGAERRAVCYQRVTSTGTAGRDPGKTGVEQGGR